MRYLYISLALSAALALASAGGQTAEPKTVIIENMQFTPAVLMVKPGDTIRWRNADFFPHNVTSKNGEPKSGDIAPGETWTFTAKQKGEFAYICTLHPSMKGTVIVK